MTMQGFLERVEKSQSAATTTVGWGGAGVMWVVVSQSHGTGQPATFRGAAPGQMWASAAVSSS